MQQGIVEERLSGPLKTKKNLKLSPKILHASLEDFIQRRASQHLDIHSILHNFFFSFFLTENMRKAR